MSEYINRDALKDKAFGKNHPTFYDGEDRAEWYEKCIEEASPADVVPVVHGHWERIGLQGMIELFECSECGFVASILSGYSKFSFCPECAAKMDLQE